MKKQILLAVLSVLSLSLAGCNKPTSTSIPASTSVAPSVSDSASVSVPQVGELSFTLKGKAKKNEVGTLVASYGGSPIVDQNAVSYSANPATAVALSGNMIQFKEVGKVTITGSYTPEGFTTAATYNLDLDVTEPGNSVKISSIVFPDGATGTTSFTEVGDYEVDGVVTALTSAGFVVDDGTGSINVYLNNVDKQTQKLGDFVHVKGTVVEYFQVLQFDNTSVVTAGIGTKPTIGAATALTGAQTAAWKTTKYFNPANVHLVTFTSTAQVDGGYTYFLLDGDTTKLEPSKLHSSIILSAGVSYTITGYCIGYNSKYSYNSIYIATAQASYDPITGITITSPDNVTTLGLGTGLKLTSTVAPATANPYVSWTSDNDSAVSVDSFGNCTALAVGEATITATSKADAAKSGSLKLTVTERSALPLTMVSVSSLPTGWTWLGQNSAEFYGTSSGGGVKCSTVGDGVKSPIFTDSAAVSVSLSIGSLNANKKTEAGGDHVFTLQGLDSTGADITSAVGYVDTVAANTTTTAVTLTGTNIAYVKVTFSAYPLVSAVYQNVALKGISIITAHV
jgi:uncharacterized protein YjdB